VRLDGGRPVGGHRQGGGTAHHPAAEARDVDRDEGGAVIFETKATARVPHECCQCDKQIKPGEQYTRVRITPRHDDYGNPGWLRYSSHLPGACDWGHPEEAPW
jgi:hypothetical protein